MVTSCKVSTMDRSALEAEIGRLLDDKNNTRWTTDILDLRIDRACVDIQVYTNAIKTTENLTVTANLNYVSIDSDVIDILQVTLTLSDGTVKPLRGYYRFQLDMLRPNWQNETANEPDAWYFDATLQRIYMVPTPYLAYTLNAIEVQQPAPLSASTDVPFGSSLLMVPYHGAIAYWVVSECLKDNNDSESLQKARFFRSNDLQRPGEYEKEIKKIMMKFDLPEAIPGQIIIQKQGGRVGGPIPSKRYPFLP